MKLKLGPGTIVAAAFIGPGTVTTATVAGVNFGTALLWALVFSTVATLVLQEMSARLGVIGGRGLGEALRARVERPPARFAMAALVLAAILLGNAAYQTGNLLGGALGLSGLVGGDRRVWAPILGILAFALLWRGRYRTLEGALIGMVAVMGLVFFVTALAVRPSAGELLSGLVPRSLGAGGMLVALGLVGTTVVPYNLFLHASAAHERWSGESDLKAARADTAISVSLGGLISIAILVTAAALPIAAGGVTTAADMAQALEPLLGRWAGAFFALGLLAAGLSSAITAPLAAAYATCGVMGWSTDLRSVAMRRVWIAVLAVGVLFSALAVRPVAAIVFAQAANGLLLPIIAGFLLYMANDRRLLGSHANRLWSNLLGGAVVLVALVLGMRSILRAVGFL